MLESVGGWVRGGNLHSSSGGPATAHCSLESATQAAPQGRSPILKHEVEDCPATEFSKNETHRGAKVSGKETSV